MSLAKTEKARQALLERSVDLSPRERQALVLCDSRRRLRDLLPLLGQDAADLIGRLMERGYIEDLASGAVANPQMAPSKPLLAVTRPVAAAAAPVPTAVKAAAQMPLAAPKPRRSLVATKMYMIDMLQLMRDPDASSLAVSIQSSADEGELAYHLFDALRYIASRTEPSYAARIGERMAQVVPETYLVALEALLLDVTGGRTAAA